MPEFTAITPGSLAELVAERAFGLPGAGVIAIDGADAADPVPFAHRVADLGVRYGRESGVVAVHDFIRPASLRLEFGHTDELSYRTAWFDYAALDREVVQALRERQRWLPALWDEHTDRSARARPLAAQPNTVLILAGPMLLGRGLEFDLTVRLQMSAAALRRHTAPAEQWTIPVLLQHDQETTEQPDLTVRWDHPDRPALRID
ncbi:hypothetical protein JK358_20350 [Nocardia sp. 2]|uniref:Uridine kinase n=1 Tax=Nocardia acididurans TaxID=2802282 RepID=A0ABS1M7Y8_9NOCA|nr:hypothetical protein [Nocardia acididurans]MBL1076752.1 hypothetical protein [Nocardia acididurans]